MQIEPIEDELFVEFSVEVPYLRDYLDEACLGLWNCPEDEVMFFADSLNCPSRRLTQLCCLLLFGNTCAGLRKVVLVGGRLLDLRKLALLLTVVGKSKVGPLVAGAMAFL